MVQDASGYAVRVLGAVLGGIAQRAREKPAGGIPCGLVVVFMFSVCFGSLSVVLCV